MLHSNAAKSWIKKWFGEFGHWFSYCIYYCISYCIYYCISHCISNRLHRITGEFSQLVSHTDCREQAGASKGIYIGFSFILIMNAIINDIQANINLLADHTSSINSCIRFGFCRRCFPRRKMRNTFERCSRSSSSWSNSIAIYLGFKTYYPGLIFHVLKFHMLTVIHIDICLSKVRSWDFRVVKPIENKSKRILVMRLLKTLNQSYFLRIFFSNTYSW